MLNEVIQAISTVGFPIIACVYVAWAYRDMVIKHSEDFAKLSETIGELKVLIEHLCNREEQHESQ